MNQAAMKWVVVATVMIGLNASVWAQEDAGKTEYLAGCAACHGIDGKGKGPLSADLKTAPADLTVIAKRNGGVFPLRAVSETIDGRKAVKSHGTRDMPIWGYQYTPMPPSAASPKSSEPNLQLFYDYYRSENIIRIRILAIAAFGGAYDAACGDANVQAYGRTKKRCYRLHPQPPLTSLIAAHNSRQAS